MRSLKAIPRTGASRRAVTLVELLAVMAVGSAVVGVAVAMLHTVLRAEAVARQRLQTRAAVSHLARQFRSDAHAASRLTAVGQDQPVGGPQWQFQLGPDRRVRYALEIDRLLREESIAGQIRKREAFMLPEETDLAIEPPSDGQAIAALRLFPRPHARDGGRAIRIEAWLGMNHRFSTPNKTGAEP
ncbi:MAG: hypothetical protein HUU20_29520 [Pirellulales bacterium]|nr:hypothetical protein [Pirellulales bacterium]